MPRSIWNRTIAFGLIAVPIKVHSATESHTIHFHQVHEEDAKGEEIELPEIEATEAPDDLAAALEASLAGNKRRRKG